METGGLGSNSGLVCSIPVRAIVLGKDVNLYLHLGAINKVAK